MTSARSRWGWFALLAVAGAAVLILIVGRAVEVQLQETHRVRVRTGKPKILTETRRVDLTGAEVDSRTLRGWSRPIHGLGRAPHEAGDLFFYRFDLTKPLTLALLRPPQTSHGDATERFRLELNGRDLGSVELGAASAEVSVPLPETYLFPIENRITFHAADDTPKEDPLGERRGPSRLPRFTAIEIRDGSPRPAESAIRNPTDLSKSIRIPPRGCLHIPVRIPTNGHLRMRIDPTSDSEGHSLTLLGAEAHSKISLLPTEGNVLGKGSKFSVDMSQFEGRLMDLFLVTHSEEASVLSEFRVEGIAEPLEDNLNILLVVIDTFRADHLGCSGNATVHTPVMDRLAREGIRFSRAFTHIPITGPSHTTLFTSRYASEAGVRNNGQPLPFEEFCLAEAMPYTGRSTFGFISMPVLGKVFHFDQGFEVYRDEIPPPWMLSASEVNARVEDEILNNPCEPFFAFVHYCEPHEPYLSHGLSKCPVEVRRGADQIAEVDIAREVGVHFKTKLTPGINPIRFSSEREFRLRGCVVEPKPSGLRQLPGSGWNRDERGVLSSKDADLAFHVPGEGTTEVTVHAVLSEVLSEEESRRNYAREVEAVDTALGDLLESLQATGLLNRTLIILTSDHGESLGEHGHMGHVEQLYDPLMAVPLIFRFPDGRHAGRTVEELVALSDIAPTVFDLLEIRPPRKLRGMSLLSLIEGRAKGGGRALFSETHRPEAREDKIAIRTPFRKLIRTLGTGTEEVYDLENDSGELRNILDKDPLTGAQLRSLMEAEIGGGGLGGEPSTPPDSGLDEDTQEALKALGYFR